MATDYSLIEEKIGNDEKDADMKLWKKNPDLANVDFASTDWVFGPIIQSGGRYDLRASAVSDNKNLTPGVIIASLGIRYKNYCSSMARTFFINPSKVSSTLDLQIDVQKQESYYSILLETRQEALKVLKAGAEIRDIYNHIHAFVESKNPMLADSLVKNIGFGTGIEYRDSVLLLSAKNTHKLKENMTMILSIGFADLTDPKKNGQK